MGLARTPFYEQHVAAGARMVPFGGWEMPVQYQGIIAEHLAVRRSVGLFDVSHMGEIRVTGPRAVEAVDRLTCNHVAPLPVGMALYNGLLNDQGGFVDDIYVYRLGEDDLLLCVNAANTDKDFAWVTERNPFPGEARFENVSHLWAQLAIQGRNGPAVVDALTDLDVAAIPRFGVRPGRFAGIDGCLLARTGYTGEDGFEVFLPADRAAPAWGRVLEAGAPYGIVPVGLGARDTLRLEVRNVLYGNDIDETTTPIQAGLRWMTRVDKGPFTGREVLQREIAEGPPRRLAALVVDKRIARKGCPILHQGEEVGRITSGTRSPSLGTNIALGYVRRGLARPGTELEVDIRGRRAAARVVRPPFYRRDY